MNKILLLVTGRAALGETGQATGTYLPELAQSYEVFMQAGYQVEIASPQGGVAPLDPGSASPELSPYLPLLQATRAFRQIRVEAYEAFFLVGGHGTMWDFPSDLTLQARLSSAWQQHKVLAAVCHGVAGLLPLTAADGRPLLEGKQITGFSNREEESLGLEKVVPFLLEDALRARGAHYSCAPLWQPHVIRDGNLITGQNPASTQGVAEAVCAYLRETTHASQGNLEEQQ